MHESDVERGGSVSRPSRAAALWSATWERPGLPRNRQVLIMPCLTEMEDAFLQWQQQSHAGIFEMLSEHYRLISALLFQKMCEGKCK